MTVELVIAIILGIVQGLTEFLPISSSGHLVLLQHLFSFPYDPARFDILLHAGTLMSIFFFYRHRLWDLVLGALRGQAQTWRYIGLLVIGTFPTAFIGLMWRKELEELFSKPEDLWYQFLGTAFILALSWVYRKRAVSQALKPIHAFIIGVAQGISIIPALSRSGLTVGSAILMGIEPKLSAEFSFLLGIPAMLGALLFELFEVQKGAPPLPSLVGFLSSMGMGVLAIALFIRTLQRGSFLFFALYCTLLGIVSFVLFPPW